MCMTRRVVVRYRRALPETLFLVPDSDITTVSLGKSLRKKWDAIILLAGRALAAEAAIWPWQELRPFLHRILRIQAHHDHVYYIAGTAIFVTTSFGQTIS